VAQHQLLSFHYRLKKYMGQKCCEIKLHATLLTSHCAMAAGQLDEGFLLANNESFYLFTKLPR
jgi:hypothetical protein